MIIKDICTAVLNRKQYLFVFLFILILFLFFYGNRNSEILSLRIMLSENRILPENTDSAAVFQAFRRLCIYASLLICFYAIGHFVLKIAGLKTDAATSFIFSVAAGSGIFSVLIMSIACVFGISGQTAKIIFFILSFCGFLYCIFLSIAGKGKICLQGSKTGIVCFLLALLLAAVIINYFGAQLPAFEYDSLEYHLAAPKEILRDGQYGYFENNMYMNIPSNLSMIYLICRGAFGESGKFINFFFGLLIVIAIYTCVREHSNALCALYAALGFYIMGIISKEQMYAHVEIAAAFFSVCCVISILKYFKDKKPGFLMLSGAFAGFAVGFKYIAALTVFIPCVFALACFEEKKTITKSIGLYAAWAAIAFMPWLLKNVIQTGNPFYPMLNSVFHVRGWNDEINARFVFSHCGGLSDGLRNLKQLAVFSIHDYFGSPLLFIFPLFTAYALGKDRMLKIIFLIYVSGLILWAFFTKGYMRFLIPLMPFIFIAGGISMYKLDLNITYKKILNCIISVIIIFNLISCFLLFIEGGFLKVFLSDYDRDLFLEEANNDYTAVAFLNKNISPEDRVLYIGEARTYYAGYRPVYNTVFNESVLKPLDDGKKDIRRFVYENNIGYILINRVELNRMYETYGYKPAENTAGLLEEIDGSFDKFYENVRKGTIIYAVD
ncbi:glycosyltransferase family 39 protein [bacterium]|jgi:hypothetical protein|nr:glycosyltransferase family 39 protein [bacterium]